MNVLGLVIVLLLMFVLGGGGMALLYMKSKPKKLTWSAKCYQVGEGVKQVQQKLDNGTIQHLSLKDLIPYSEDVLVRKDLDVGKTVFELQKLGLTTNAVTADMVDVWGKGKKEVHVLLEGSTATVLKYGYDIKSGNMIFTPMPRERIELVTSEIATKQARLKKDKTNLAALTTWIIVGMAIIGFVGAVYFMTQGVIKVSQNNKEASQIYVDGNKQVAETFRQAIGSLRGALPSDKIENFKYSDTNVNNISSDIIR